MGISKQGTLRIVVAEQVARQGQLLGQSADGLDSIRIERGDWFVWVVLEAYEESATQSSLDRTGRSDEKRHELLSR